MQKKFGLIVVFVIAISAALASALVFGPDTNSKYEEAHYHAGFQIYTDSNLQDFSGIKYMHIAPCSDESVEHDLNDVKERVHLHNGIGDVTHVHAKGTTWRELFASLEILDLIEDNSVMLLNGEETDSLLDQVINPYDSAVFSFGDSPSTDVLKTNMVTREMIEEAESQSESCGS